MKSVDYGDFILHQGDCLDVLRAMPDASVDSVVTDPPYGLAFMGKKWDYDVPSEAIWVETLRVLKPGGHLLAFAGTRTQHRMAVRIEDAGFEIRDMIAWVYGSGFPKSRDVSKALDAAAGAEREVLAEGKAVKRMIPGADQNNTGSWIKDNGREFVPTVTAPATAAAAEWAGWGTALKPALEPITVARKPLIGTVAVNVLAHGTGGLNVDGCRVGNDVRFNAAAANKPGGNSLNMGVVGMPQDAAGREATGRWPANLIHDGSDEVLAAFPTAPGQMACGSGSAARFFYCAKASKADRGAENTHPTVKPTELMRYLCRLVTPPGGVVLDPFMGSGSTGKGAVLEGFKFIGIDRDDWLDVAGRRIATAKWGPWVFGGAA